MPKRQTIHQHTTPDIQGDDSWVKVRSLTYGQMKTLQKEIASAGDAIKPSKIDEDDPLAQINPEKAARTAAIMEITERMVIDLVYDWNWVDEDDQKLPIPKDDPSVIEKLTHEEFAFLSKLVIGGNKEAADPKKSSTSSNNSSGSAGVIVLPNTAT